MTPKTESIVKRVESARADLLSAVEGLSPAQCDHQPGGDPNVWSISDVLHHLVLTDEASAKLLVRMLRKAREAPPPPDPDPNGTVATEALDAKLARADSATVSAPEIVVPTDNLEKAEALSRLQVSRLGLLTTFEALSAYDLTGVTFPHPFFGGLNTYEWVLVTGWHERRHTRQIERIKAAPSFPSA